LSTGLYSNSRAASPRVTNGQMERTKRKLRLCTLRSGFTLFELLIVLVLLGLFSFVLFSRVGDFLTEGDLRAASRVLISEIQRYRAMAAYSRAEQFLALDMEKNTLYGVDSRGEPLSDTEATTATREKSLPSGVHLEDVVIHPRGKIQEGVAVLRFSVDGSVERAVIHLRNEEENTYTLQLNPFTGTVKIHETYVDQKAG